MQNNAAFKKLETFVNLIPSYDQISNILYSDENISKSSGCLSNHNSWAAVQWPLATKTSGHREQIAKLLARSQLATSQESLAEQSAVLPSM